MHIARYLKLLRLDNVEKDKKIATYILWAIVILFLLITAIVYFLPTTSIDLEFSEEVQESRNPVLGKIMRAVSVFGINQIAIASIVFTAVLCFVFSYRREAFFILLTSLASVANFGIKLLIQRPRPTKQLVQVMEEAKNNSFPSGHTVHYVVFFGFLLILMYRMRRLNRFFRLFIAILSVILILAVPFSRVYLGAHWFTDVLAGFFLGIIILAALLYFYFKKPSITGNFHAASKANHL